MSRLADGLAKLGVRRMLLAIHDASFPSEPDEDIGRGAPTTRAAGRLFVYARELGFTGIQLGPQGQTSRGNPSPYDSTIFGRHLGNISLGAWRATGLVSEADLARARLASAGGPAQHAHAHDASHALLEAAYTAFSADPAHPLRARLDTFRAAAAGWLDREGLYFALAATHGGAGFRDWPAAERDLWLTTHATAPARAALSALLERAIDRHAFGQLLVADEHAALRTRLAPLGLALYGDLQVGYADADAWAYAAAFRRDYRMGAPPSRTNPEGQPWGYPVLDPDQHDGAARALVVARADKSFADYDSLRLDHPHGLVCPWVYRGGTGDDLRAVREGARLFESPDLSDHPALARLAIARADQLDRSQPRYADGWVTDLDDAQVDRYAQLVDAIATRARERGRDPADLSCEVLSTMPRPLERVLARYALGRWRVTQKANLDDPTDVYRTENVAPADWVMLGNHDTAPVFALLRRWSPATREHWARHLAARLRISDTTRFASDGFLATAMVAELLVCRAENVSIFFADLFGYEERFNVPGLVDPANWTLRLPADFEQLHADRLARGAAIDLPLAVELALAARRAGQLA